MFSSQKLEFGALPIPYTPGQEYYLGCPDCGAELDRRNPEWHPLAPERVEQRRWSYRLSQLLFPGIDLAQIVAAWQLAIRDPAHMTVFCTDRLALPKSSTQTLTPHDLQVARGNYALGRLDRIIRLRGLEKRQKKLKNCQEPIRLRFPQINLIPIQLIILILSKIQASMGVWIWATSAGSWHGRLRGARLTRRGCCGSRAISAERVRTRVPELFRQLDLAALCVDAGPLRDLSRDLTFLLNDLDDETVSSTDDASRNISSRAARRRCRCAGRQTPSAGKTSAARRWNSRSARGRGCGTRWRERRTADLSAAGGASR